MFPLPVASTRLFLILAVGIQQFASAQNWRVVPANCHDVVVSQLGDTLDIRTTGNDPYLAGDLVAVRPNDSVLEMECFAVDGVQNIELFLGPPFSKQSKFALPPIPVSETWKTYQTKLEPGAAKLLAQRPKRMRLDLGKRADVRLQIRGLRFRPQSSEERDEEREAQLVARSQQDRAQQITRYITQRFPLRIESVIVSKNEITLAGSGLSKNVNVADVRLIECPPWADVDDEQAGLPVDASIEISSDSWRAVVPRIESGRDRLHSSWRIAMKGRFLTARHYPTKVEMIGENFVTQRPLPANQKGLGGLTHSGPLDELPDLGVSAVTVNIPLGRFLVRQPGLGRELITDSVYFNTAAFKSFDVLMNWARKNNVVVSAILLVPVPEKDPSTAPLVHPANDGGRYSMPNLTNQFSTDVYAFVLNRLARRYSNPTKAPGGITNWIAHNEVDHHKQWTNMGTQPRAIVTETYYRSMRMIYNAARSYNPHARVFASLTHSWMVPDDGKGDRLAPREVLIALQRYSILEGDFEWGVAYHPYPQSLFAATAWDDTKVTDAFDTPLITIQNIEVLENFLAHRLMLDSSRQPRPILLSEQGFHTDSYEATAQANQAGSLSYAMQKIAKLKTVESFHYHRWIDHPTEGGLKMGLRTLPSPGQPHGEKKQSWHVYQAIGTPREKEFTRDLPGPKQ